MILLNFLINKHTLYPKIRKIYGKNSYAHARKNFDIKLIGNKIINIYDSF